MYHAKATLATARRVLQQLHHDKRTLALIFVVPCVLLWLLRWVFSDSIANFDHLAPALLGVFPFLIMFIVTSITTLRERTSGTLERLMALPIAKLDFIMGYMLAFGLLAIIQAGLASTVLLYWIGVDVSGPHWFLIVLALANAILGTALGLFVSAFARTEFQAVQFMPVFVIPQLLVCGLFLPITQMPDLLQAAAYYLPLTYATDALSSIVTNTTIADEAWRNLWVVLTFALAAVLLGALTLPRRTK